MRRHHRSPPTLPWRGLCARLWLAVGLLLVGLVSSGLARAPVFQVPIEVLELSLDEVEALPLDMAEFSDVIRAEPEQGYDWVFPMLSAKTTWHILHAARSGHFRDPEMVRHQVGQFYELYAKNQNALIRGEHAEPGWVRAWKLSRWLWRNSDGAAERRSAALIQAIYTVYVHVVHDLPRSLLMVERHFRPDKPIREVKKEFFQVSSVFGAVIEDMIQEEEISPPLLRKLWPHLPSWLRHFLTHSKFGFGAYLHVLRRVAWMRYRWQARRRRYRQAVDALTVSGDVTTLLPPPEVWNIPGVHSPARPLSLRDAGRGLDALLAPAAPGTSELPALLAAPGPDLAPGLDLDFEFDGPAIRPSS